MDGEPRALSRRVAGVVTRMPDTLHVHCFGVANGALDDSEVCHCSSELLAFLGTCRPHLRLLLLPFAAANGGGSQRPFAKKDPVRTLVSPGPDVALSSLLSEVFVGVLVVPYPLTTIIYFLFGFTSSPTQRHISYRTSLQIAPFS